MPGSNPLPPKENALFKRILVCCLFRLFTLVTFDLLNAICSCFDLFLVIKYLEICAPQSIDKEL